MCYHYSLNTKKKKLEEQFNAVFEEEMDEELHITANGFTHLRMPVITNTQPAAIRLLHWGLIPFWAKDSAQAKDMANKCLNAKIETIEEKSSFRDSAKHKRCIIPATSFYEWKWLDSKGKSKEKYEIGIGSGELFAFGGLWSGWTNKETGEIIETFSIVTTEANPLMAEIHNTKKRMPLIMTNGETGNWLNNTYDLPQYAAIAQNQHITAKNIEPGNNQLF